MKARIGEKVGRASAVLRRSWIRKKLRSFPLPYRLHLGCGRIRFEGWVNIDADRSLDTVDLVWNLSHGLPVEDASCDLVYHEHFIEHRDCEWGKSDVPGLRDRETRADSFLICEVEK